MTIDPEDFTRAIATELRAQRAREQITLMELSKRTGYAKSTIHKYLVGKRVLPLPALVVLCQSLGVSPVTICERAEQAVQRG